MATSDGAKYLSKYELKIFLRNNDLFRKQSVIQSINVDGLLQSINPKEKSVIYFNELTSWLQDKPAHKLWKVMDVLPWRREVTPRLSPRAVRQDSLPSSPSAKSNSKQLGDSRLQEARQCLADSKVRSPEVSRSQVSSPDVCRVDRQIPTLVVPQIPLELENKDLLLALKSGYQDIVRRQNALELENKDVVRRQNALESENKDLRLALSNANEAIVHRQNAAESENRDVVRRLNAVELENADLRLDNKDVVRRQNALESENKDLRLALSNANEAIVHRQSAAESENRDVVRRLNAVELENADLRLALGDAKHIIETLSLNQSELEATIQNLRSIMIAINDLWKSFSDAPADAVASTGSPPTKVYEEKLEREIPNQQVEASREHVAQIEPRDLSNVDVVAARVEVSSSVRPLSEYVALVATGDASLREFACGINLGEARRLEKILQQMKQVATSDMKTLSEYIDVVARGDAAVQDFAFALNLGEARRLEKILQEMKQVATSDVKSLGEYIDVVAREDAAVRDFAFALNLGEASRLEKILQEMKQAATNDIVDAAVRGFVYGLNLGEARRLEKLLQELKQVSTSDIKTLSEYVAMVAIDDAEARDFAFGLTLGEARRLEKLLQEMKQVATSDMKTLSAYVSLVATGDAATRDFAFALTLGEARRLEKILQEAAARTSEIEQLVEARTSQYSEEQAAVMLQRWMRKCLAGIKEDPLALSVKRVMLRHASWCSVYVDNCLGSCGLNEGRFCQAMETVRPCRLSKAQKHVLYRRYLEGTGQKSIDMVSFCTIVSAVVTGDEAAAEYADMDLQAFEALGEKEFPQNEKNVEKSSCSAPR